MTIFDKVTAFRMWQSEWIASFSGRFWRKICYVLISVSWIHENKKSKKILIVKLKALASKWDRFELCMAIFDRVRAYETCEWEMLWEIQAADVYKAIVNCWNRLLRDIDT